MSQVLWTHTHSNKSHHHTKNKHKIDPGCDNNYPYFLCGVPTHTHSYSPKKWTYRAVTWCQFEPYDLTVRIDNADFLFAGSYTHGSFLTLSWGASGLKTLWMIFDQQSLTFPHSQSHGFSSCSWMEMLLKLVLNDFTRACKDGIFGNPKGAVR